jgi:hypothetical protein
LTACAAELDRYGGHAQFPEASRVSALDRVPRADDGRDRIPAALDTMQVMKLIDDSRYARGIELLEGIVAMLTKMT